MVKVDKMKLRKYVVICPTYGGYRIKKFNTLTDARKFAKGPIKNKTGIARIYKLVE